MKYILLINLLGLLLVSCNTNSVDKQRLVGSWELLEVKGENNLLIEHEKYSRPGEFKHYLIVTNDSIVSIQQPCYCVEKGKYSIVKNKLVLDFQSWRQENNISVNHDILKLVRRENNSVNTYIYKKVNSADTVNHQSIEIGMWQGPSCLMGSRWEFTGRTEVKSNFVKEDQTFSPPQIIDMTKKDLIGWEKSILSIKSTDGWIDMSLFGYNGMEITLNPYKGYDDYDLLSDTGYIYRRIK